MSIHLLEEMSSFALDRLDRARTVIMLTVSPLEEHGPHLPVGVDAFTAVSVTDAMTQRGALSVAAFGASSLRKRPRPTRRTGACATAPKRACWRSRSAESR